MLGSSVGRKSPFSFRVAQAGARYSSRLSLRLVRLTLNYSRTRASKPIGRAGRALIGRRTCGAGHPRRRKRREFGLRSFCTRKKRLHATDLHRIHQGAEAPHRGVHRPRVPHHPLESPPTCHLLMSWRPRRFSRPRGQAAWAASIPVQRSSLVCHLTSHNWHVGNQGHSRRAEATGRYVGVTRRSRPTLYCPHAANSIAVHLGQESDRRPNAGWKSCFLLEARKSNTTLHINHETELSTP